MHFFLLCAVLSPFHEKILRHRILHAWRQSPPNLWIISCILEILRAFLSCRMMRRSGNSLEMTWRLRADRNSSWRFPALHFWPRQAQRHGKESEGPWGYLCLVENEDEDEDDEDDRLARCSWESQEAELVTWAGRSLRKLSSRHTPVFQGLNTERKLGVWDPNQRQSWNSTTGLLVPNSSLVLYSWCVCF